VRGNAHSQLLAHPNGTEPLRASIRHALAGNLGSPGKMHRRMFFISAKTIRRNNNRTENSNRCNLVQTSGHIQYKSYPCQDTAASDTALFSQVPLGSWANPKHDWTKFPDGRL